MGLILSPCFTNPPSRQVADWDDCAPYISHTRHSRTNEGLSRESTCWSMYTGFEMSRVALNMEDQMLCCSKPCPLGRRAKERESEQQGKTLSRYQASIHSTSPQYLTPYDSTDLISALIDLSNGNIPMYDSPAGPLTRNHLDQTIIPFLFYSYCANARPCPESNKAPCHPYHPSSHHP